MSESEMNTPPEDEANYDPDGLGYPLAVATGMKSESLSNRTAAETIWKAIAAGDASDGTMLSWVEYVAAQLVQNLIDNKILDDRLRGMKALNATGLWGTDDMYRELRSHIDMGIEFGELAGIHDKPMPMDFVSFLRGRGLLEKDVTNRNAAKRVARLIEAVLKARAETGAKTTR